MADLRKAVPSRYPIRTYPDITHSQQCQFPVPDWDVAFSLTEGREVINPRPRGEAAIFRYYQPGSIGFISYSEGCNDDVNKIVWSGLGWDPEADVEELLRQYTRAFIGEELADEFCRGAARSRAELARTACSTNREVDKTLAPVSRAERQARPQTIANWRFQQALYRAYYDAYVRTQADRRDPARKPVLAKHCGQSARPARSKPSEQAEMDLSIAAETSFSAENSGSASWPRTCSSASACN